MFYTSVAVQINQENTPPTQNRAEENYFRFGSAILEMDGGPPAGLRTVDLFEIGQEITEIRAILVFGIRMAPYTCRIECPCVPP